MANPTYEVHANDAASEASAAQFNIDRNEKQLRLHAQERGKGRPFCLPAHIRHFGVRAAYLGQIRDNSEWQSELPGR